MSAVKQMTEPSPPQSEKFVTADGLNWHVVETGEIEKPVVLLVHGTAASVHSWRDVMPLLADTHHVVAIDLPGHGLTKYHSASDLSLERMGRGVASVMTSMGLAPTIVAGHSAGAAILAWACARKLFRPEKYVSFNGAFYPYGGAAAGFFSPIAKFFAFNPFVPRILSSVASHATVQRLLRDTGSELSEEGVELYFNLLKQSDHIAAALGMMAAWDLTDMDDNLARISADCIFVAANNDKAVPPDISERAAVRVSRASVMRIDGFGHLLHEENPALAADILKGTRK
jgi:magnesium chelatase accessory protein